MKNKSSSLLTEGFAVVPLENFKALDLARNIVNRHFEASASSYCELPREQFHTRVENCQIELNESGVLVQFAEHHQGIFEDLLINSDLAWVSVMKLRAVRPSALMQPGSRDHVGLHRESLYAASNQVAFQYNIWTPLSKAASTSGMWYVPFSHLIPDSELCIEVNMSNPIRVERYSSGHRIGLPYMPKEVSNSPVVLNSPLSRFNVPYGHCLIFSAMLLHGGGENTTSEMRFSMDTGIIPNERIEHNGKLFAARGNCHYSTLEMLING